MKTKNSAKGDNQRQGTPQDENYSQEELLNMDELFDLQGGIDDKQLESCGRCVPELNNVGVDEHASLF